MGTVQLIGFGKQNLVFQAIMCSTFQIVNDAFAGTHRQRSGVCVNFWWKYVVTQCMKSGMTIFVLNSSFINIPELDVQAYLNPTCHTT